MADANMRILLSAVGGASVVSAVQNVASAIGSGSGGLVGALTAVGTVAAAGAIALGVTAVNAASTYQSALSALVTGAGELPANLNLVSNGILNIATATGTTTAQLTSGMYMIESAGYHGAAGLQVLQDAAQGARVGNADLGTVSDATTTIMKDFASQNVTSSQAVNDLIATVSNGKTTMQALAASLSSILPTASAAHVSLADTSAALATMTGEGIPAAQAATFLRQTLIGLDAPSKQTTDALKAIGLNASDVSDEMQKSLPGALQTITDALAKKFPPGSAAYVDALKNIAGGSKNMQGILALTGTNLATFQANVTNVTSAVHQGGNSINGWSTVQQNFSQKMDQAREVVETLGIRIGTALLPVVSGLLSNVVPLISRFSDWVTKSGVLQAAANGLSTGIHAVSSAIGTVVGWGVQFAGFLQHNEFAMDVFKGVLIATALVIGALVIPAMIGWAASMVPVVIEMIGATLPFVLIIAAIGLLVAAILWLIQHWQQVVSFLSAVWNAIANVAKTVWGAISAFFIGIFTAVGNFFRAIWNGIVAVLTQIWNNIKTTALVVFSIIVAIILLPFLPLINFFKSHWAQIHAALTIAWNAIKSVASTVWNTIVNAISGPVKWIKDFLAGIWNDIKLGMSIEWNAAVAVVTTVWGALVNIVSGPVNTVRGWLSNAWNTIKSDASGAWKAISDAITSAFGNVVGGIKWIINKAVDGINAIIGGINNVSGAVGIPPIPKIPHLAAGTTNFPGGMALVGENGPELVYLNRGAQVIPNNQLRGNLQPLSAGGAGGATNIFYISISTMARSQSEVRNLVDMVEQELGRRMRTQTPGYNQSNIF